jgi:LuxR family maltose regulon positive regulatory protein
MPEQLVQTKLVASRLRPRSVDRPRLLDLLAVGSSARLTLVSAPAGFGKTTLIASWLDGRRPSARTAWVSLDARDTDATTYWTYLLVAVDRAAPGSAAAALDQLRTGRTPVEALLAGLLNELSVLPEDLTVVLDDYHLADGPGIQPGMAFLVDHLPPQVHLVISTRADPGLPLPRLRVRGELVEIRAADLRFTVHEAATYLDQVHDVRLPAADVATLESRTEGWAAALQLAALSLRGRSRPSEFVAGFAGADRFVVDYLADEVLDRQSPDVRRFLLHTSVLERMSGPLCDALTGGTDGRRTLVELERANLFVVALDDQRRWYRYHHLFADVLRAHLLEERPDDVRALHRCASDWFDRHDDPEHAVSHALAAGDVERAATLVELALPGRRRSRREAVIRRWADELPADVVADRPVLALGLIGAFSAANEFDGLEKRLEDLERLLDRPASDHVVVDRSEYERLPGAVPTYQAAMALVAGDLPATVRYAELARQRAAPSDLLTRASAAALTGIAAWTSGDLTGAHHSYAAAADGLAHAGHTADVLGCTITLVDLDITLGRLSQAQRRVDEALHLAERDGTPLDQLRGTADMHVALSRIAWERGDVQASARHLDQAEALGEDAGLPQNPYRWRVAMARLREAAGDLEAAVGLLDEARRLYVGDFAPDVRPVAADLARVLAARGDTVGALAVLAERGVTADDDLTYLREQEHVTLARLLLASHDATGDPAALSTATHLACRLLESAQTAGRIRSALEVLILLARAHAAAGDRTHALEMLDQAIGMAEPGGYLGVFGLDGEQLRGLLDDLSARQQDRPFLRRLRETATGWSATADASWVDATQPAPTATSARSTARDVTPALPVEPLSDRERDVLRYLCSDLDGPAITRELSVSLSTVRTHTQHIYTKLGVSSRRAAVRRAHQLDLLAGRR